MFRDHKSYRTLTEAEKGKRTAVYRECKIKHNKKYKCDLCYKKWMTEIDMELHRRITHGVPLVEAAKNVNSIICWVCFRPQPSNKELVEHVKTMHFYSSRDARRIEREVFFCDMCQFMFFNKKILEWHIFYTHGGSNDNKVRLECIMCMKLYTSKKLWHHSISHNLSSFTTCPFCFETVQDQSDLRHHVTKHNSLFRCETCQFDVKYKETYTKHLDDHSKRVSNDVTNYEQYFMSSTEPKYYVERWLKGIQVPRGVWVCILCREICTDTDSKIRHICIDHGNVIKMKKTNRCSCGEEFFNALLLKHHVWKMKGSHRGLSIEEIKDMDSKVDLQDLTVVEVNEGEEERESFDTTDVEFNEDEVTYVIALAPSN